MIELSHHYLHVVMALDSPASGMYTTLESRLILDIAMLSPDSSQAHGNLESLEAFSYNEPLEGRDTRLIEILKAEAESPIECRLVRHSLDSCIKYQALSYVWGDPDVTRSIACEGRRFDVTNNLHDALLQLRKNNEIRENSLFWIDAICIDQGNIQEMTSQIRIMMDIYSHATYTIIWLGKRGFADEDIFEGVKLLYTVCDAVKDVKSNEESRVIADRIINEDPARNSYEIWKVFKRVWFGRIWVVQEYVASASCQVYIGNMVVSPALIFEVAELLRYSGGWVMPPQYTALTRANPKVLNAGMLSYLKVLNQ